jgi:hypothetical protein
VDLNVLDSEDGEHRRSEQSRGLHLNLLESGDVLWSDKEGVGGQSRVEEWIYVYYRAEMCYNWTRRI